MSRLIKSIPVAADFCQSTLRGSDCYFEGFAFYDDKTVGYRSGLPAYEWYYEEYEDVRFIPAGEQQSYAQIRLLKSVAKEESRTGLCGNITGWSRNSAFSFTRKATSPFQTSLPKTYFRCFATRFRTLKNKKRRTDVRLFCLQAPISGAFYFRSCSQTTVSRCF